jgi:Alg9-like mannosyltransferase family
MAVADFVYFVLICRANLLGKLIRMVGIAAAVGISCVLVDSFYYGQFSLVPLNFFLVNVYNNLGNYI